MIPPWLEGLRQALHAEFGGGGGGERPCAAALATATPYGAPRVRHVIVRGLLDDGSPWLASDARSEKNAHVRSDDAAEMALYLPGRRTQYRLRGRLMLGDVALRRRAWPDLSDASRALFFWPAPGTPRAADASLFPAEVAADVPPPDNFEVLVLSPMRVELLDVAAFPHLRRTWTWTGDAWQAQDVNP